MKYLGICFSLAIILVSCHPHRDVNLDLLLGTKVNLSKSLLKRIVCSKYSEDSFDSQIFIVNYMDSLGCLSCKLTKLRIQEEQYRKEILKEKVEFVYVVDSRMTGIQKAEDMLFENRFEGIVYVDSCNAFLSANPQIPDNELFHTFVINNEGKVLMVGNPFQNEKMETLFKKVIANERKKQKSKKPA